MSIIIPFSKTKTKDQAYKIVKNNINEDEFKKWNVKADMEYDQVNHIIKAKGMGFEVTFEFFDGELKADAKMGLLLKPMKNKVLSYLEHRVKKFV